MSAETFLDCACVLWLERDDACEEAIASQPGEAGNTWRDWLMDFLSTAYVMGEGFDGKRPNCGAGWGVHLEDALHAHQTSFVEVLLTAFGMHGDMRPRAVLRPFGAQSRALRILARGLDEGIQDRNGDAARSIIRAALAMDEGSNAPAIAMDCIAAAKSHAVAQAQAHSGEAEHWSRFGAYLDALVMRRHPTYSFLGMPLMW